MDDRRWGKDVARLTPIVHRPSSAVRHCKAQGSPVIIGWVSGFVAHEHTGGVTLESNELARKAVEVAEDRKAEDIVMLDIRKVSIIADYFVICTGTSERHVKAIAKEIDEKLGDAGVDPINTEGMEAGEWVLMDYGTVLVHIFDKKTSTVP